MIRLIRKINFQASIRDRIKQERETRLGKVNENILPTRTVDSLALIRNIGIIAHIDAGKTTTTERMLYYAGALPSPGQIDEGTTTMDYMKQQRERGITIRSAAISFNWNKCQINLIDTPGHVDFSGEVTRALRVLDGAVTILDGVKGVQAQTMKVWEHATKRGIPRLCFINKLDRIGSSIMRTAEAIQGLLKVDPIQFQMAVGQGENFRGVVDLISMRETHFKGKYGEQLENTEVKKDHPLYAEAVKKRLELVEKIANYDDLVGDLFLNEQPISEGQLKAAVRRILNNPILQSKVCPIFLGSAFRNKGVQLLMDAVVDYLPSPTERPPVCSSLDALLTRKPIKNQRFSAYSFKVICDSELGALAYTRIYSGELRKGSSFFNSSRGVVQKVGQIFRVRANQYAPVAEVTAGDIVAIAGLKETRAGETLTEVGDSKFVLEKLELPSAIFTMPIELRSKAKQNEFLEAMGRIVMEDNSLLFREEVETGQYLVSGLGELHLEVVKDKLIEEGIDAKLGNLKIGYRETVREPIKKQLKLRTDYKGGNYEEFELELEMVPLREEDGSIEDAVKVVFDFPKVDGFEANWREFLVRKQVSKTGRRSDEDETKDSVALAKSSSVKRSIRNPTPIEPISVETEEVEPEVERNLLDEEENESEQSQVEAEGDQQQPYFHINTLPFETLYDLVQICKISMLSGSNNYPLMGVQLRIGFGKFQKKHFSKTIMNRTASQLVTQLLNSSVLVEPILEFVLEGEQVMIEEVTKDILRRRGRVDEQLQTSLQGVVPAGAVRGWIKELRVMGLEVTMKFSRYEEISGIDPRKLIEENR